jgi:hypothetical protein
MKTSVAIIVLLGSMGSQAIGQEGMPTGSESRGAPINSSVRASSIDPETGLSPGATTRAQAARAHCRLVTVKTKKADGTVAIRKARRCS